MRDLSKILAGVPLASDPLGMTDTFFCILEEKVDRFACLYSWSDDGILAWNDAMDSDFQPSATFESGGGVVHAGDYIRREVPRC